MCKEKITDQPISPAATSSKTNWLLLSLIGVVILIVGVAIGLLMGKYIFTPKSTSLSIAPASPTLISGLTLNWQTYTNSAFDFSIQYPPAWKITTDLKPEGVRFIEERPVVLIHDDQLRPDPDVGPNSTYPSHYVGISTLASSKTLQEFLDSMVLGFSPKVQKDTREFMDQKTLTVNGIPAVSFIEPGMGGRGKMIAVSNGKYIVLFSFPYQLDGEKNDNFTQDKDYTQILSTFKFVDRSSSVSKWQGYDYLENEVYTTNNWLDFQGKKGNIHYIFNFPWNWEKTNSVFLDENGAKVAELSPGGVETKPGQTCFDKSDVSTTESRVKIISTIPITINGLIGVLQVREVQYEVGGGGKYTATWYPNVYCLQKGDEAFVMTFYETSPNSGKQSLFEEILATFDFVN